MIPQNWKQLASLQIGGVICLPMIMVGHILGQTYGLPSACVAILIGNLLLLGLSLLMFSISYPSRLSTMEQARHYFGPKGVLLLAMAMTFSMLGWFAIQLNMMSQSLLDVLSTYKQQISPVWINLGLGCLITGVGLYGLRALNILANVSLPLLILTLGCAVYMQEKNQNGLFVPFSLKGSSIVFAAAIAAVIDLPTYFRHATSKKDGWISLLLIFGVALPLIEATGVYLASHGTGDLLIDHFKNSTSILWNIWIALFLILAGWTTNNTNLYSGAVSLSLLLPGLKEEKRMGAIGIVGTVTACFDLLGRFELVLEILGLLLVSMGAVILTRALAKTWIPIQQDQDQSLHLIAWIIGVIVGLGSILHLIPRTTTIALLDTFLATSIITLTFLIKRKYNEKAYELRS